MKIVCRLIGCSALFGLALLAGPAAASDNKIALIPGGPHPYFKPWEQAAADAKKDFGIASVDFKVPSDWKLNLQTELIESLVAQGYKAFGIFPGDAVGINSTVAELKSAGIPSAALAGCAKDPTDVAFCLGTDVYHSAYLGTKELIKAMGGKGNIVHLAGLLVDPNTTLRVKAVEKAVDETNGAVKLLQTIADTDAQEAADQKINALLGGPEGPDRRHDRHRLHPLGRRLEVAAHARRQAHQVHRHRRRSDRARRDQGRLRRRARWRRTPTARAISAPMRSISSPAEAAR